MSSTEEVGSSETIGELVERTRGPRARIIDGLLFYEGEAHAQQLRKYGDIPSRSYHFKKLMEQGLIEQTGEEYISDGGNVNVYRLTDLGREVSEELFESSEKRATVTELEDRINHQQQEIEELQRRYDAVVDYVEDLENRL